MGPLKSGYDGNNLDNQNTDNYVKGGAKKALIKCLL